MKIFCYTRTPIKELYDIRLANSLHLALFDEKSEKYIILNQELKAGGDPMNRGDWSKPKRVVRADGTNICEAGKEITLDMTEFEQEGEIYAVWSQRQFLPKDLGAWLYIAKLNPDEP